MPDFTREGDFIELDSVGGTMLYFKSECNFMYLF